MARKEEKHCKYCGKTFYTATSKSRYCSDRCRAAAFRARKKQLPEAVPAPGIPRQETTHTARTIRHKDELFAKLLEEKRSRPYGKEYWQIFKQIADRDGVVYDLNGSTTTAEEYFADAAVFVVERDRVIRLMKI